MHGMTGITVRELLKRAALGGGSASLLSAATLAVCSKLERNSFAGGLNGPSQWLWGEREAMTSAATLKHTAVGYVIHHLTSTFWAALYEKLFGGEQRKSAPRVLSEAAVLSAAAYVVDYKLTPRRLRPGFEKHVRPGSMFAVYACFALGLAAATLLRERAQPRLGT
jgi:hypothetical protein